MIFRPLHSFAIAAAALSFASCATNNIISNTSVDACEFSAEDTAWVDGASSAWRLALSDIIKSPYPRKLIVIFFDDACRKESPTFLTGDEMPIWTASLHGGAVGLPDGESMLPVVASFAGVDEKGDGFFVMSTPSVWRAGGVTSEMGLELLMWPVMLHEASHSLQAKTYGRLLDELTVKEALPENLDDDSVQRMFEGEMEYEETVDLDIVHFLIAANSDSDEDAKKYIREALAIQDERYQNWLSGEAQKYREIDRVFLTMEGSGQWLGYTWLIAPEGGAQTVDTAKEEFGLRSRWHSQRLGFAMFLALDRVSNSWKAEVFGGG